MVAQQAVAAKSTQIPALPAMITTPGRRAAGAVITAGALHTQTAPAAAILAAGADYLFTVKSGQPTLLKKLARQPPKHVPVGHADAGKPHGRRTRRTLKVIQAPQDLGFLGASQIAQLRRASTRNGRKTGEVVHLITSAVLPQASPDRIAAWIRGHQGVENRLHRVRDVTFDEDRSQIRTGQAPHVMASLRNLAISIHRLAGTTNIAQATRQAAWDPPATCTLLLTL